MSDERVIPPPFPHHGGHVCNPFNDPTKRCTLSIGGGRHICQTCGYVVDDYGSEKHTCGD